MTQAGETTGYSAADHVQAIVDHIDGGCIDSIVIRNESIRKSIRDVYNVKDAETVVYDRERLIVTGLEVVQCDIIDYTEQTVLQNRKRVEDLIYYLIKQE